MSVNLFDYQKLQAKEQRAVNRNSADAEFFHIQAARIIGERLSVTMREFSRPALLFDGMFSDRIEAELFNHDIPVKKPFSRIKKPLDDILPIEPQSLDLVVSIFDLHRVNDLPSMMQQLNFALKPDGLLMAILPCEGSLTELRDSLLTAETLTGNGAGLRVDPFAQVRQLGDLLQKTGFRLPVADLEERLIRYGSFERLLSDLRNAAAGNVASEVIRPIARKCYQETKKNYQEKYSDSDEKLRVTINLACLSGWKDDPGQQKPLKPGSAKHHLRDFI